VAAKSSQAEGAQVAAPALKIVGVLQRGCQGLGATFLVLLFLSSEGCAAAPRPVGMPLASKSEADVLKADVLKALGPGAEVLSCIDLQQLWAGYGMVHAVHAKRGDNEEVRLIVKRVRAPQIDEGDQVGHARKLKSYQVEAAFYRHVAPRLLTPPHEVSLPTPLLLSEEGPGMLSLVMSDLSVAFPDSSPQRGTLGRSDADAALDFLARFHAAHWEEPPRADLWEQGGYWPLATRHAELAQMRAEWAQLQAAAPAIDRRVRGLPRDGGDGAPPRLRFRTLVHGDFKAANLLFSHGAGGARRCAAYDLQYCGGGYAGADLVMLLVSAVGDMTPVLEATMLQAYLARLEAELDARGRAGRAPPLAELTRQYELCLLDFLRFLAGWGMWGDTGPRPLPRKSSPPPRG